MARNIEIKARVFDLESLEARISTLTADPAVVIDQDDIFFGCANGRLKLRRLSVSSGELIFYRRDDLGGPKPSFYEIVTTDSPDRLRVVLGAAWGEVGRVVKRRRLFLVGRTRIHVDQVEGLGDFMELEVVLAEGEPEDAGIHEAEALMATLGIAKAALLDCAYVDLLERQSIDQPGGRTSPNRRG
ncbi:MAG: class IV adenylate cyclase [Gammaproteobacteria bacterium]|nr:class IV adenylate cyclase [Gammaproteobacteria bacterium]